MEQYVDSLVGRYRRLGVLVDTNLLLLIYIGAHDPRLIDRFSRTRDRFVQEDFHTLASLLGQFRKVVTTPYILTEVSNMLGYLWEPARRSCFQLFAHDIRLMHEQHTSGADLSNGPAFVRFGITDASVLEAAVGTSEIGPYLVLTDDFDLFGLLSGRGVDVLNFNNIRSLTL